MACCFDCCLLLHLDREESKSSLQKFDQTLDKIVAREGLTMATSKRCGNAFLDFVFARELDENADGLVTQEELLSVQIKAETYAKHKFKKDETKWTHSDWLQLLRSIFVGFDRDSLGPIVDEQLMQELERKLKVRAEAHRGSGHTVAVVTLWHWSHFPLW